MCNSETTWLYKDFCWEVYSSILAKLQTTDSIPVFLEQAQKHYVKPAVAGQKGSWQSLLGEMALKWEKALDNNAVYGDLSMMGP